MNTNATILVISFIFIFITSVLYFTKKKVLDKENVFLSILLIISLFCLGFEYLNITFINSNTIGFPSIIHNTYEIFLIIWITIFFLYYITLIIPSDDKKSLSTILVETGVLFIYLLAVAVIITLIPSNLVMGKELFYESGKRIFFIIFIVCFYMLYLDINIFLNKDKNIRKLLPLITFQLLFFSGIIVRKYVLSPEQIMPSFVISLVVLIMTNTIENQDLKFITELSVAKQETEKATRAKSDFLSSMSHEIRTPLNAIIGLSEVIAEEDVSDSVRKELKDINYASQTLLEIVGNILDINKIESNKIEIQNMNYYPNEIVNELLKMNKVRIGDKDIKLESHISPDVPYELVGDKIHIKQIINNLLSNAIKYTDKGSVSLNLFAKNDGFVCHLIIQVVDTGKGIKISDYNKLFNKFERLDTEINSTIEGSGLGLAITKRLVQLLNGSIRVKSTFGEGSIFEVEIPQSISMMINPKQVELEYRIEQIESGEYELNKASIKKILLCDDSQINLRIATSHLKGEFLKIDTCLSGRDAIELARKNHYDLIFLDLKMPNMDGFKTLDELKRIKGFNTPVIAFTAVEEDVESTCLNAGFSGFLIKPFSKEQIVNKVNEYTSNYKELRNNFKTETIEKEDEGLTNKKESVEIEPLKPVVDIKPQVINDTPVVQIPKSTPNESTIQPSINFDKKE